MQAVRPFAARALRLSGRVVAGLCVLALSPVLGLATLAGVAMFAKDPRVFTYAGLAVFAAMFFLGLLRIVPRPSPAWARWLRALALLAVEGLVVWQVGGAVLTAPPGDATAAPVRGMREWDLDTGSRLAYLRLAPKKAAKADPVIVLHDGPGRGDLGADGKAYGALAEAGYQVYAYDQLGTGRSARLEDPSEYSLARDVQDLEAIRQAIGAPRMILLARGHGARLAAAYLALHPGNVAKMVLDAPAPLADTGSPSLAETAGLSAEPLSPRLLAAYTLLRVSPTAAHAFAGDAELDRALSDRRPVAVPGCPAVKPGGAGGYASLARRTLASDVRQALRSAVIPVLVLKSPCDGQPWQAAIDYRAALPGATLAYPETPASVRDFLDGRPVKAYAADQEPPGYR